MKKDLTQLSGMPHVLVVDDDRRLRSLLKDYLSDNGFLVLASESAGDARAKMEYFDFDIEPNSQNLPSSVQFQII